MSDALRTAILGTRHPHVFSRIELLRSSPEIELIGFVEEDPVIAARLGQRTGLPRVVQADLGRIDLAVIEGLDPQIPQLVELAVDAGARGVLLEKPGARDPSAFGEMAGRLAAEGTIVEIGYELHYADAVQQCREIVRSNVLGPLTMSRFHGGCPIGAGAELWQSIPEDLGGLFYTEGCHVLELVYDLFGVPEHVSASIRKLPKGNGVKPVDFKPDLFSGSDAEAVVTVGTLTHEDVGTAILEYQTQTVSVDLTAWEPTTWCAQWWIELYGLYGSLVATPVAGALTLHLRTPRGRFAEGETVLECAQDQASPRLTSSYARQLRSLIDRVLGRKVEDGCGLGHAEGVMRMLEAIYASARSRSWVALRPSVREGEGSAS